MNLIKFIFSNNLIKENVNGHHKVLVKDDLL